MRHHRRGTTTNDSTDSDTTASDTSAETAPIGSVLTGLRVRESENSFDLVVKNRLKFQELAVADGKKFSLRGLVFNADPLISHTTALFASLWRTHKTSCFVDIDSPKSSFYSVDDGDSFSISTTVKNNIRSGSDWYQGASLTSEGELKFSIGCVQPETYQLMLWTDIQDSLRGIAEILIKDSAAADQE